MAAIGNMKIEGCKVAYWKHTYRVTLPTGTIFWGTSYLELTKKELQKAVENLMVIFQAGKNAQCIIIKEALQL